MRHTIFACTYVVDGITRHAWFRVPGSTAYPAARFPTDCVIWVHGGGQDGAIFMNLVPPRPDRIDVFPTALQTNGSETYVAPDFFTDCRMPRAWVTPGVATTAPFGPGYSGPGPDCLTHAPPWDAAYSGPYIVDPQSDPKCPWRIVLATASGRPLDTWTDLRFLSTLVQAVQDGTPPDDAISYVGPDEPATWNPMPPMRFWLAGFSKGGILVLWAHAYNNLTGATSGITKLGDISGYWMSSAPMPMPAAAGVRNNFLDFSTFRPTPKICGYWHGGDTGDDFAQVHLPGLPWTDSADILKTWYGGTGWSSWVELPGRGRVCTAAAPVAPPDYNQGLVRAQYCHASGTAVGLKHYEVITGGHAWTACGTPGTWDEALVATNLWRRFGGYGT